MKTVLDYSFVMCLISATKGKTEQGIVRREENSEGLGAIGIDFVGKYGRGFGIFMYGRFRVLYLEIWEREFEIGV